MNVKKFVVVMKKYSRKLLYVYSLEHSQREGISIVCTFFPEMMQYSQNKGCQTYLRHLQ